MTQQRLAAAILSTLALLAFPLVADESPPIAEWDGGEISGQAYEQWLEYLNLFDSEDARYANVQRIFAIENWAEEDRKRRPGLTAYENIALLKVELSARVKRTWRHLRSQFTQPIELAEAVLAEHPDAFHKPERRRLYNIFLRFPEHATDAEKQAIREKMEEIRANADSKSAFEALAKAHSDSQSSWKGGHMGVVDPAELAPRFAAVTAQLTAGQLSDVVESASGLVVFYCDSIVPARTPGPEEQLRQLHQRITDDAWLEEREKMEQQLFDSAHFSVQAEASDGAFMTIAERSFTQQEASYLIGRMVLATTPREELKKAFSKFVVSLELLRKFEPPLTPEVASDIEQRKALHLTHTRAMVELGRHLDELGFEPTEEQIQQHYEANPNRYKTKQAYRFEVLIVPPSERRDLNLALGYRLAAGLRSGELTFSGIASQYPGLRWENSGGNGVKLTLQRLFFVDTNLIRALDMSDPGEIVVVETEKDGVWIMQFLEDYPPQRQPLEVVREQVIKDLKKQTRQQQSQTMEKVAAVEAGLKLSSPNPPD